VVSWRDAEYHERFHTEVLMRLPEVMRLELDAGAAHGEEDDGAGVAGFLVQRRWRPWCGNPRPKCNLNA